MTGILNPAQSSCAPLTIPAPEPAKTPWLLQLQRHPLVNTIVKRCGLHRVADAILRVRPLVKRTPGGCQYYLRSVASIVAAKEIFETGIYRDPLSGETIRRFVDLGCNVGFFPLLLAELAGTRELEGLMIDGNHTVLHEAEAHMRTNGLKRVKVILGLAGFADTQEQADFLINPASHIASTATGRLNPDVPSAGRSVKVTVPCINVEQAWKESFGDAPIDLLKVDIEGMELELFRNAPALLARSSRVLFEWHKWQVSIAECNAALVAAGFDEPVTIWEDAQHGLGYCKRRMV